MRKRKRYNIIQFVEIPKITPKGCKGLSRKPFILLYLFIPQVVILLTLSPYFQI